MARIPPVQKQTADAEQLALFDSVEKEMGRVPNIIATMANSTAAANAYLGFSQSLAGGSLPAKLREQIALVVGEANGCDYCVAAHTALGKVAGLSEQQTCDARRADSDDPREMTVLAFARKVVQDRGIVLNKDVQQLRDAGYNDGAIAEIVANVALNIFTNYFNHIAETEIDFPAPSMRV